MTYCQALSLANSDGLIPALFQESWQRDLLRAEDHIADYRVHGKIDVEALRKFHSSYLCPAKMFKPMSDEIEINSGCWVPAAGEKK